MRTTPSLTPANDARFCSSGSSGDRWLRPGGPLKRQISLSEKRQFWAMLIDVTTSECLPRGTEKAPAPRGFVP
jgi:hypothetical protein